MLQYSFINSFLCKSISNIDINNMINQDDQEFVDDYKLLHLLGEGGQASVYLAKKQGHLYAVKVYFHGQNKKIAYQKQVTFLSKIQHQNLINIVTHSPKAAFKLRLQALDHRPLLVLQYAQGGQLFQYLQKTGAFPASIARYYTKSIINALKYLYENNIAHRDLKPQNLLFDSRFDIKIADFGLARDARGNNDDFKLTSTVGTQGYSAPQIFRKNYQGASVDLFATGVILFNMYTKRPPFKDTTNCKYYNMIKNNKLQPFWNFHQKYQAQGLFTQSFKNLFISLVNHDPKLRPTLQNILSDKWLNQDDISAQEAQNFMFGRYSELNKKKNKKEIIMPKNKDKAYRADIDLQDLTIPSEQIFAYRYDNLTIIQSELPKYTLNRIHYSEKEPKLLVAWIQTFVRQKFLQNQTFIQNQIEQIKPIYYSAQFLSQKSQIQLKLSFEINSELQSSSSDLILLGQLHQSSKGKTGIDWLRISGNSFWLYKVIACLNEQLESL